MYEVALRRREPVAEGTLAFYFDKPAGFSHEAGQNAIFTLVEPPAMDAAGPSRPFTIASAPQEPELMIATRMRDSAFKRYLAAAAPGTKLQIDGPAGNIVPHEGGLRPAGDDDGGAGDAHRARRARGGHALRRVLRLLKRWRGSRHPIGHGRHNARRPGRRGRRR